MFKPTAWGYKIEPLYVNYIRMMLFEKSSNNGGNIQYSKIKTKAKLPGRHCRHSSSGTEVKNFMKMTVFQGSQIVILSS